MLTEKEKLEIENPPVDNSEILSAFLLRKKDLFKQLLSKGASVTVKFEWKDILKTFNLDPNTLPKSGTIRELIELTNDEEYLALINDENYAKILEENDKLYRLDIDLPF